MSVVGASGGRWVPFTGYPAFPARPAGGGVHCPKKAVCRDLAQAGVVVSGDRQRLLIGVARVKAGRQRLGRPSSSGGLRGVGNYPLGFLLGVRAFQNQTNRDSRGGSYFLVRGEIL